MTVRQDDDSELFFVECPKCGMSGPLAATEDQAVAMYYMPFIEFVTMLELAADALEAYEIRDMVRLATQPIYQRIN